MSTGTWKIVWIELHMLWLLLGLQNSSEYPVLHFFFQKPHLYLLHFKPTLHGLCILLSLKNYIFQDELLCSSAAKSAVCAGFEFQWCTSVPLGRVPLRCRGTSCVRVCVKKRRKKKGVVCLWASLHGQILCWSPPQLSWLFSWVECVVHEGVR